MEKSTQNGEKPCKHESPAEPLFIRLFSEMKSRAKQCKSAKKIYKTVALPLSYAGVLLSDFYLRQENFLTFSYPFTPLTRGKRLEPPKGKRLGGARESRSFTVIGTQTLTGVQEKWKAILEVAEIAEKTCPKLFRIKGSTRQFQGRQTGAESYAKMMRATRSDEGTTLRHVFELAVENGVISSDPAGEIARRMIGSFSARRLGFFQDGPAGRKFHAGGLYAPLKKRRELAQNHESEMPLSRHYAGDHAFPGAPTERGGYNETSCRALVRRGSRIPVESAVFFCRPRSFPLIRRRANDAVGCNRPQNSRRRHFPLFWRWDDF